MNQLRDLFSEEELDLYEKTEYPFNLSILHKALKSKIELEPDYEVWVPLVYYKFASKVRNKAAPVKIVHPRIFLSNKGNACSLEGGNRNYLSVTQPKGERHYPVISVRVNGKTEVLKLHRALGCCFVPLKEELGAAHPKELEINHVDGFKENYSLDNLEWCTGSANVIHAYANGLTIPSVAQDRSDTKVVKGKILKGLYAGHEFVMFGKKECDSMGFTQPNVNACCNGRLKTHKGCDWAFATEEEVEKLPRGISPEIINSLNI